MSEFATPPTTSNPAPAQTEPERQCHQNNQNRLRCKWNRLLARLPDQKR